MTIRAATDRLLITFVTSFRIKARPFYSKAKAHVSEKKTFKPRWVIWKFPQMGVPPVIIHFHGICPCKPASYWGTPSHMETPISSPETPWRLLFMPNSMLQGCTTPGRYPLNCMTQTRSGDTATYLYEDMVSDYIHGFNLWFLESTLF